MGVAQQLVGWCLILGAGSGWGRQPTLFVWRKIMRWRLGRASAIAGREINANSFIGKF